MKKCNDEFAALTKIKSLTIKSIYIANLIIFLGLFAYAISTMNFVLMILSPLLSSFVCMTDFTKEGIVNTFIFNVLKKFSGFCKNDDECSCEMANVKDCEDFDYSYENNISDIRNEINDCMTDRDYLVSLMEESEQLDVDSKRFIKRRRV